MDVILIAPTAIDVDALERLEIRLVAVDEQDRIVLEPALPAFFDDLARLEIEREAETQRRLRVGIVGRGHAYVHDAVTFRTREFLLAPDRIEKTLDAAVVEALGQTLASAGGQHVEAAGTPLGQAVLGQLVQRVRPVVPVDEVEVRVAGMIGDRPPVLRVLHAVDDRAIAPGGLAEAAAVRARGERAELAVDKRNQLAREIVR